MCVNLQKGRFWIVCLSIAAVLGCDSETTTAPSPVTPADTIQRVARVIVYGPTERFNVGDSTQFTAVVMSQTNKIMEGQLVQWTSSDTMIASVSELGFVRGQEVGQAIITATVGDKSGEVNLSVNPGPCTKAIASIEVGETLSGALNANSDCLMRGEPVQGWQFTVTESTLLEINVNINMYFAHLVLTDAQLQPVAEAYQTGKGLVLRQELPPGNYIAWVGADWEDGGYAISLRGDPPSLVERRRR